MRETTASLNVENEELKRKVAALEQQLAAASQKARNFEEVAHGLNSENDTLKQQLAAERANAERWEFMRQFLSVEDVGGEVPMSTVVIHECAFDSAMVGVDCHLSVDEAFDASRAVATRIPVEGE
ncbi:hypothetical protein [Pectobacterium aroidearum]|uniref:hypothetical protein n=1 Tax=Pectobacterium aroidearum TaxID=1201031 RepID=UPI0030194302